MSAHYSNARYTVTVGSGKYLKYVNTEDKFLEEITLENSKTYKNVICAVFLKLKE